MKVDKVNVQEKFEQIADYWNPRIAGELNGQQVKLVKFKGEFPWHKHDNEDEMFFVVEGTFTMELKDRSITLSKNEFLVIPRGTEHRPVAETEACIMLFEPDSTLNTGNRINEFTRNNIDTI